MEGRLNDAQPLVSVVIPSHNRARYIADAVRSVQNQTYPNVEIAIVDDGSTDTSPAVIDALGASDPRVKALRLPVNRGAQAARNAGIQATSGEWVAFLDSDDQYLPDSVELRLRAALTSARRVVHSDAIRLAPDGSRTPYGAPALQGNVRRELLSTPGTLFPSLLVRRDVLLEIGGLDESIVAWQEWETSIRLSKVADFAFVTQPTFEYDVGTPGAISRATIRAADGYEQIVRKHRRPILREVGVSALGNHYLAIARQRWVGRDVRGALRCGAIATVLWPPLGMRAVRELARSLR